eukprot:8259001-Ditylum_brightwellii.AAC.1
MAILKRISVSLDDNPPPAVSSGEYQNRLTVDEPFSHPVPVSVNLTGASINDVIVGTPPMVR